MCFVCGISGGLRGQSACFVCVIYGEWGVRFSVFLRYMRVSEWSQCLFFSSICRGVRRQSDCFLCCICGGVMVQNSYFVCSIRYVGSEGQVGLILCVL